jgi:divalent metal cation (Fe/Co/Zn/Cd) transporter
MAIEGAVAIISGVAAHSLSLLAFGIDSIIELVSAGVLVWRLTVELQHGEAFSEAAERAASRLGGALIFSLAAYVVVNAGWTFWNREGEAFSLSGLIVALIAIPTMYVLARAKLSLAGRLGRRTLRADAVESAACFYLSGAVAVGLAAQWLFDAWWIDAFTSLAIVYFLIREGREAWQDEYCCEDARP